METENMVRAADSDNFLIQHTDFSLREQVNYPNGGISRFYDNGIDMVIIDENICDHNPDEPVFSYMLITDKQNSYIHQFKRVFRFLGYIQSEVDSYLANDEMTLPEDYRITVGTGQNRRMHHLWRSILRIAFQMPTV